MNIIIPDIEIWGELDEKICILRETLNMALESLEETDREIDIELERQRLRERELIGNSISDYDRAITVMDRLYIDNIRREAEIMIKRIGNGSVSSIYSNISINLSQMDDSY
jgi:hypothetical protein